MSTHPNPLDRFENVHKQADKWQKDLGKTSGLQVKRDSYLALIDGLTYGPDPKQGYVHNGYFYHPELKFFFTVPSGWKTQNSPIQFQMAPADGKALSVLRLSSEKTLNAAVQKAAENLKLNVLESQNENINGYSAIVTVSDQQAQDQAGNPAQPQVRLLSGFIQDGSYIYELHNLTSIDEFNQRVRTFENIVYGFRKLTDPAKINVEADRIKIATVGSNTNLQNFLSQSRIKSDRFEEHAILNGMELSDALSAGMKIKLIEHNFVVGGSDPGPVNNPGRANSDTRTKSNTNTKPNTNTNDNDGGLEKLPTKEGNTTTKPSGNTQDKTSKTNTNPTNTKKDTGPTKKDKPVLKPRR